MRRKTRMLCLLAAVLCLLTACSPAKAPETPPPSQSPAPSESQSPSAPVTPPPSETPAESVTPSPAESAPALTVDGEAFSAMKYESPLGYTILCPEGEVTVIPWDGGDTFPVDGAEGTYLAVTRLGAPGLSAAVSALQFEYAVEGEPEGCLFGAKGYAGMRLVMESGDLSVEFILCKEGEGIYLVELALYGEGAARESLLKAMRDTITFVS